MPSLRPPYLTLLRTLSTTAPLSAKSSKSRLLAEHIDVPAYPYGPSYWYKQSNFGLYGGARKQFGNNVSSITETKTRRTWDPNIQRRRLYSKALGRFVRIRISTRVLRTVDKVGGLDEYLLGEKPARLKELGMAGWKLRWRVMQTAMVQRRFNMQRVAMGLEQQGSHTVRGVSPASEELRTSDGRQATDEQVQQEIRAIDKELDAEDARAVIEGEGSGTEEDVLVLRPRLEA